jgi:hypothetical protein
VAISTSVEALCREVCCQHVELNKKQRQTCQGFKVHARRGVSVIGRA